MDAQNGYFSLNSHCKCFLSFVLSDDPLAFVTQSIKAVYAILDSTQYANYHKDEGECANYIIQIGKFNYDKTNVTLFARLKVQIVKIVYIRRQTKLLVCTLKKDVQDLHRDFCFHTTDDAPVA